MTPVLRTVGILVASGAIVASSLLLTRAAQSSSRTNAVPSTASGSNQFLTALPESSHILRGASETHVAVSIVAPAVATAKSRPPLSVAIVLDRSGSMEGEKLRQAKRAASELIAKLDARDHFSVTVYGTEVETVISHRRAEPAAVAEAAHAIESILFRGGTNLAGGLVSGRDQLEENDGSIRRIVLISDGQANRGIISQAGLAELATETAASGISITTVGIGLDFDEKKMTAIAVAGRGNYYFAERAADLASMFATELGRVTATAATNVEVSFHAAEGVELLEAYGHHLKDGVATLSDLHAGETRRIVFRVRGRFASNGNVALGTVRLGLTTIGGERVEEKSALELTVTDDHHAVVRGQSADAIAMIERARTAVTLERATDLYEAGDTRGARRIVEQRRMEAKKRAAEVGSKALGAELDGITRDAEASFAPAPSSSAGKSSRKRNRNKSYELLH